MLSLILDKDQLETIQRILQLHFEGLRVYAYGERLSENETVAPDAVLSIAVISEKPIPFEEMVAVEKAFSEKNFPFHIDIVDWLKLPESLQKSIKKESILIQGES
ncbi:MAG: nucleotidyltransferase domain-containing protein [Fibrobacter sp.]|jgi:hypothetical protein|nr:nucleotidyltransferase domain-containing protein [Fibrobacter sp.]